LKTLAANPRSVDALTGAGRAALDVGDAQAALGFLARAEDESPRDGRIKMWIGSALVQLEQPHAALKFFRDAAELGVAEAEIAKDRGLAYDITGDQRRAQRDYRLALQRSRDAEVVRRLALSLAIGGDRQGALALLDEQGRSPAGERTRALVLALTGDAADAGEVIQASMPGAQGAALMPFLARLPGLSPTERALAVHLGHFPQDGRTAPPSAYAMNGFRANVASAATPGDAFRAGRPDPLQPGLGRSTAALVRAAPAETEDAEVAPPVRPPAYARAPAKQQQPATHPGQARATAEPPPLDWTGRRSVLPGPPRRHEQTRAAAATPTAASGPANSASAQPPVAALSHPLDISRLGATAAEPADIAPPVQHPPPAAASAPHASRLAALAATVATLPGATVRHAAVPAAKPTAPRAESATPAAKKPVAAARKAEPKLAARHWVQLGIGEDQEALPGEFARLRGKAGKLLAARAAWTAPMGETNRLLIGPFESKEDAQDFVNALAEKKLRAFAWTSAAGEKVAKLPAK
jgi:Flp pilus assembly protein TadD